MILRNNTILQNRYLVLRLLGQGGFGAVYEARDQRLGHRVALKQLTLSGQAVQKAFEREARILARLKHGALPKVSDYFADANDYFLVMEFIQGDDLEAMLAQRRDPFAVEVVLGWAFQVLEALEYLHGQQPPVVHRDIKPANIKISPAGNLYLLDFGISKGGRTHTHQAMSGASIQAFSEHYASIEQIEGHGTDGRSDLYSLAVMLHHLLTKQEPPRTVSRARAKLMNKADPLRPVNELNPLVPLGVAQVLTSALNFDPSLRPDSARTMRQLLQDAIRPKRRPIKPSPQPRRTTKRVTQSAPWTQWQPWVIAVGGVIVLVLGIFLGTMLINDSVEKATIPQATPIASSDSPEAATVAPTEAPIVTNEPTVTLIAPTATAEPTSPPPTSPPPSPTIPPPSPTNTPIPALGIGSTITSEKDQMTLLYVPEGDFEMGAADDDSDAQSDEKPRHTVFLDAFWIDQTEVTNEMYRACVEADVCRPPEVNKSYTRESYYDNAEYNNYPVIYVSWDDATTYCQWAGRRLPTEAEWEKAARGTDGRIYPWGNEQPTGELVNFCDSNCSFDWKDESVDDGYADTSPVGNYPAGATPYGAFDMGGNVWEWVNDFYHDNYYAESPRDNPQGASVEAPRVVRGGSWNDVARILRAPNRASDGASVRFNDLGFRCAASDV